MIINMKNPFGDELDDSSNKNVDDNRDSEIDEVTKMLMRHIKENKQVREVFEMDVKAKQEKKAKKRRENRLLKKAERIARIMPNIREKHKEKIQKIVDRYSEKFSEKEVLIRMMTREGVFLRFAKANQHITYEESLEEHYVMFLDYFKMGD